MWITWPWSSLQRGGYIELVRCRVSGDKNIISAWEELRKGDEGKVRPMVRSPSVPSIYSVIHHV